MLSPHLAGLSMSARESYLFYEAGQAVAAVHLGLAVRHVSANPAMAASDIVIPRTHTKARMILWLTGLAAEKKGVGKSDPLRRTRNRQRVRSQLEFLIAEMSGPVSKRHAEARNLLNQAQDRANAICANLYDAIQQIADRLRINSRVSGSEVRDIVLAVKARRSAEGRAITEDGMKGESE